jgi:hypothetical protein
MVLRVSSDASYLSEPASRSRTGGHFYLRQKEGQQQLINGPLLCLSSIMKHVMSSAAEAEVGCIFNNAKEAAPLQVMLEEMGHPHPHPHPHSPTHPHPDRKFNSIRYFKQ